MGKTSFQNINDLVKELSGLVEKLNSGNLPLEQMEEMVNHAKEIYERMIVIRHKAYEQFGEPEKKSTEKIIQQPVIEKSTEISSIDFTAFEDESARKVSEPKTVKPVVDEIGFDFTETFSTNHSVEKNDPVVTTKEEKKTIDAVRAEIKSTSAPIKERLLNNEEDLNSKLKKAEEEIPLRKKLQIKPIADFRTEIGIGKKFEYINFLFGGDSKAYENGIDVLNACQNAEEAKQKLNEFGNTYNWNLEEKTIVKFIELIERKFI